MRAFDQFRYGIAVFLVVFAPAAVGFWLVVHPLARFWREVGHRWGYAAGYGLSITLATICFRTRSWIAATDLGAHFLTTGLGLAMLVVAGFMRRAVQRQLRMTILLGQPELAPDRHPGRLLTEGPYARVRHPRYAQVVVAVLGWALVSNHVAAYASVGVVVAMLAVVIPLEERELAERFGEEYEAYRRRVPALLPRRGSRRS